MILGILIPNTDDADTSGSKDLYDDGNCDDEKKVTHSVADIAISGVKNFMGNKNETTSARPKHVKLFCKFMRAIFVCATLDSFSVSFFYCKFKFTEC